ncbi:hypothetical protein [Paraflavitalea sp. CAU 1676]|uniref:hypothetical protein n=1 Tax=Paraflavitalea sp. CAU 1676 TaxID=3032598 RepID=UPI0023DBAAE6|nr:hypothetical protein [Paraflavitalea sp. CAU 1676]MDF2186993.1 hypothetical protein [Paraflavitalea sp. CAU 1676]
MSKSLLHNITIHLDIIAPLVAFFFAYYRKEKKLGEHVFIVIYLFIQLVLNTGIKVIMHANWGPNIYLYKANCLFSFIVISLYFLQKWKPYITQREWRLIAIGTGIISLLIYIIFTFEQVDAFNSYSYSITALFICTYCILYYYQKLLKPEAAKITHTRSFWFVSGLFLYYAGSFFIFLSFKFLTINDTPNASWVWKFHNLFFVPMCAAFSVGFRCQTNHTI